MSVLVHLTIRRKASRPGKKRFCWGI